MQINRLRLLGFKSFVEPTELVIERGLTGVVGPNGCGKSNLLEALRWVMGETSHKSMRAAAMEDVIFSGTSSRPARNMAEVTIFLDNSARNAPAEFNGSDVIEIARRIEREAGSAYRINGQDARARDVKLLFEDASTGARSPALVRQGQIGEIVNAKPEQRRRILEDAAGIAGLHTRRHEAELRLKAAEANLARLGDVLGQLTSQMESLKRQARAARRYKDISADIRKSEAILHHLTWTAAQALVTAEEAALTHVLAKVAQSEQAEARALRGEIDAASALPALREAEAKCGAALARLKIEQDNFEREARRSAEREAELQARAAQLAADTAREKDTIAEAAEVQDRLDEEIMTLVEADEGAGEVEEAARARLDTALKALRTAEARLSELTHRAAELRAKRSSLEQGLADRKSQAEKLQRQLAALEAQHREVAGRAPEAARLAKAAAEAQALAIEVADLESKALAGEDRTHRAAAVAKASREAAAKARLEAANLKTEVDTLAKLLLPARDGDFSPVADLLKVARGYEAALGAALGEDLDAPVDTSAPVHWSKLAPATGDPPLPAGVAPLSAHVKGAPELTRRLAQIGVVKTTDGARLQKLLATGQRLVSREGDLWRWDGFVAAAHGMTPAAQRLAERNRLADLQAREAETREQAAQSSTAEHDAAEAHRIAEESERALRQQGREAQARLAVLREQLGGIERAAREAESKLSAITEAKERAQEDLLEAHERLADVEAALEHIAEADDAAPDLDSAHVETAKLRTAVAEAQAAFAGLERERQMRAERLSQVRLECERWATRHAGATKQIEALEERITEARAELETLADLPALIEEKRDALFDALETAETERQDAADALAAADTALREAKETLRAAQIQASSEREAKARIEAKLEAARQRRAEDAHRIREQLGVAPDGCLVLAGLEPGAELPDLPEIDRTLSRLKADRDRLGGVNLAAEEELTRITDEFNGIDKERADVEEAIHKLRGAIGSLNREGKKRLEDAFNSVNGHFQRLFTTLFGGGEARLEMIESEDPLEGGLEIVAKPPGKKPATLSLLSGGEQTLTAMSLIFAVFLTNPSPICVLDEVDAPLDDANVDRFCTLMESMAKETDTRFLVITHHPMTMARMSRLFGVTMVERGISQLVSVDLEMAQRFLEAG